MSAQPSTRWYESEEIADAFTPIVTDYLSELRARNEANAAREWRCRRVEVAAPFAPTLHYHECGDCGESFTSEHWHQRECPKCRAAFTETLLRQLPDRSGAAVPVAAKSVPCRWRTDGVCPHPLKCHYGYECEARPTMSRSQEQPMGERDTVAIAVLRERGIHPDRNGNFWNYNATEAYYHTETPQQALRSRLPERYAEVYESPQIPTSLPVDALAETTIEEATSGAELGRWYADRYHEWAALADRAGDLLFLRLGPRFVMFGEHATIVANLYSQSAYTKALSSGEDIGPIYALANPTIAEHTITILMRQGHGVAILEPAQYPLTTAEAFRPARLVRLTKGDPLNCCEQTGLPVGECSCFQHAEPHVLAIRRGEIGPDVDADEYALLMRYDHLDDADSPGTEVLVDAAAAEAWLMSPGAQDYLPESED